MFYQLKFIKLISIFFMVTAAQANTGGQLLEGTYDETEVPLHKILAEDDGALEREEEERNNIIENTLLKDDSIEDGRDHKVEEEITPRDKMISAGHIIPDKEKLPDKYLSYDSEKLLGSIRKSTRGDFNFFYIDNEFDHKSANNSFDSTYRGSRSRTPLMFTFSGHKIYGDGRLKYGVGAGMGVAHHAGRGTFVDNTESNTKFQLWSVPVDLSFILSYKIGTFFKMGFTAGPSVIGINQNRDDFEDGNDRRNIRQWSYGYFGTATMHFSLTSLFPKNVFNIFIDHSINEMYFALRARMQNYANFQDSGVEISGVSFGAGFTFEYF